MKKKNIATVAITSIAIVWALMYLVIAAPRKKLDSLLREVATVQIGKTKLDEWRTKAERANSSVTVRCDQRTCAIGWLGENELLWRLHLAPRTAVGASVGFENGIASEIYIILVVGKRDDKGGWRDDKGGWRDDKGVVVRQSRDVPSACNEHYKVEVKQRNGVADRYWATVAMDPCVSRKDFSDAVAINSACLTRIGACKTVEAILPKVLTSQ